MKTLEERCKDLKWLRKEIQLLHSLKDSYGGHYDGFDQKLEEYLTPLLKEYELLVTAISKVSDPVARILLLERFVNGKTWDVIAIALGYDYYHTIKRLKPKAIARLQAVLDEGV